MVNPFGKDWFEPMILWIVIVMPTGAGKSTLFKFLRGILDTVRKRVIASGKDTSNNDALPDWAVEEASMEKMGAMMAENGNKLIGLYDEITHFLTQINVYRNRGLSDTHFNCTMDYLGHGKQVRLRYIISIFQESTLFGVSVQ